MKNKYTKIAFFILVPVIVIGCIIFINSGGSVSNKALQDNWDIKISGKSQQAYTTNNDDGYSYTITKFDADLKTSIDWKSEKDYDFEIKVRNVLQALNITKENYPNFYTHYKFYEEEKDNGSLLYLIYNEDDKKLITAEYISK